MPDHTFDGPGPHTYTSSKDAAGAPIGTVEPGEIRDTDGPLDHMWRETAGAGEEEAEAVPPPPKRSGRAVQAAADDKQEG